MEGEPGGKDGERSGTDGSRVARMGNAKVGGGSARGAPDGWGLKVQNQRLHFLGIS